MITKEKLDIYIKYNGDIDGWVRMNIPHERKTMKDKDWYLIDDLIQDIILFINKKTAIKPKFNLIVKDDETKNLVESYVSENILI